MASFLATCAVPCKYKSLIAPLLKVAKACRKSPRASIKGAPKGKNLVMREIGQDLSSAKERVQKLVGVPVLVKINAGRGRSSLLGGVVTATFPAVFSVKLATGELKTFSYADVQTRGVMFLRPEQPAD